MKRRGSTVPSLLADGAGRIVGLTNAFAVEADLRAALARAKAYFDNQIHQ